MWLYVCILLQLLFMSPQQLNIQKTPRKLYIFSNEQHSVLMQQQLKLFYKDSTELKERDTRIIIVKKESILWKEFNVAPDAFTVILIGKDFTEKYRTSQLLQPATLYNLIDAMPMRRQEIQNKKRVL